MGVYCSYQAMPVQSQPFKWLQTEQHFCVMYGSVSHRPAGPYDIVRLPQPELDELLKGIAENAVFGSRGVVDRVYTEPLAELARAAEEFPGLPQRATYMQRNCHFDAALARARKRLGHPEPEQLVDSLVLPDNHLAPDDFSAPNITLHLVQPESVAEGAKWLQKIDPDSLGESEAEDFRPWRAVYVAAAEHGEAVVVS